MVANVKLNIAEIARKTQRKLETFQNEFTQDMAEKVVDRTPVDTGFARGSWFAALNNADETFTGSSDTTGATTVARMSVSINGAKVGDTIYVLNSANYIGVLENGSSGQAPNGMVAVTVNDAPAIAQRTAERISRQ